MTTSGIFLPNFGSVLTSCLRKLESMVSKNSKQLFLPLTHTVPNELSHLIFGKLKFPFIRRPVYFFLLTKEEVYDINILISLLIITSVSFGL